MQDMWRLALVILRASERTNLFRKMQKAQSTWDLRRKMPCVRKRLWQGTSAYLFLRKDEQNEKICCPNADFPAGMQSFG